MNDFVLIAIYFFCVVFSATGYFSSVAGNWMPDSSFNSKTSTGHQIETASRVWYVDCDRRTIDW